MDREDIRKQLGFGIQLGVRTQPDSDEYFGWMLVSKRPAQLYRRIDPDLMSEEERRWYAARAEEEARPYHVHQVELLKRVHESGDYELNEDMRNIRNWYLATLEEVETVLVEAGFSLKELARASEIHAP